MMRKKLAGFALVFDWGDDDLTALTQAALPAASGSSLTAVVEANGNIHVYYISANQHINQFLWNNSNFTWSYQDLTGASRTPTLAALGSALTGFAAADGSTHVFHFDSQPHVEHLWGSTQNWQSEDATVRSGASAVPAPAGGLSSFAEPNGTAEVYYVDTQQHINQLEWNGQWRNRDLSRASAFQLSANTLLYTLAAPQTALTSLLITGDNHVYFVSVDGHVHQIYWDGQQWADQDLTTLGRGPAVGSSAANGAALPYSREYIYGAGRAVAIENGSFGPTPVVTVGNGTRN